VRFPVKYQPQTPMFPGEPQIKAEKTSGRPSFAIIFPFFCLAVFKNRF